MPAVSDDLLTAAEAARRLGIKVATLYDWLGRSRIGELEIRRKRVTINCLQAGAKGQGRIRIEAAEVDRLRELMRVQALPIVRRAPRTTPTHWPGITVPLGRPPGH